MNKSIIFLSLLFTSILHGCYIEISTVSKDKKPKIAIIGDFNPESRSHQATNESLAHSIKLLQSDVYYEWIPTDSIDNNFENITEQYKAFWIAPGSPYKCISAVLRIIQYARLNNIPVLGTCGGFQHMAIEFARNALNISDATHAEYEPDASKLIINPLSCNIKGHLLEIELNDKSSKVFATLCSDKIYEKYYCNFGLNPQYQTEFEKNNFKIVGTDANKEARILELKNHIFYIATLFVPQDNSSESKPHPLITSFIKTIL